MTVPKTVALPLGHAPVENFEELENMIKSAVWQLLSYVIRLENNEKSPKNGQNKVIPSHLM